MASVVNKNTLQYLKSVHTPDYDTADWLINPDLSTVDGVPRQYWKIVNEEVVEMTTAEKDAVDKEKANAKNISIAGMFNFFQPGTSQNKWLRTNWGQATNRVPFVMPQPAVISALTFINDKNNVDVDLEIYVNDSNVLTWEIRDKRYAYKTSDLYSLTLSSGDKVGVFLRAVGDVSVEHATVEVHYTIKGNVIGEGGAATI